MTSARRIATSILLSIASVEYAAGTASADDRPVAPAPPVAPAAPPTPAAPGTSVGPLIPKRVDLPAGVIARVRGRDLTTVEFEAKLVERLRSELGDPQSSTMGVLQILIEETVVLQEAGRLGIRVTTEDYDARYGEIDAQVRSRDGGGKSLADVVREQGMSPLEFRKRLEDQIRKERIASDPAYLGPSLPKDPNQRLAQVEVVIKQLMKKAIVEFEPMPVGVVAKISGAPVTVAAFGSALRNRLAESEIRRHLQEICLTMLLAQEGLEFAEADVDAELALDRPLWERMRTEALTPEKRDLPFDAFLQIRYNATLEDLHKSPYRRGLFGLRRRLRASVTDDAVLAAWKAGSQTQYGPSFVVSDILVGFVNPKAVAAPTKRRTVEEARRLAADFARRLGAGEKLSAIEGEIKAQGDRTVLVEHRAVVNDGNDLMLYGVATGLKDGEWAAPIETMAEIHLIRREKWRPAAKLEDIRPVVKQHLVDQNAQLWLSDRMRDDVVISTVK